VLARDKYSSFFVEIVIDVKKNGLSHGHLIGRERERKKEEEEERQN
jgi:hypothetical protein